MKVLDVSYSQPSIDYSLAKKDIEGVIIRCGRTLWGNFEPGADGYWEAHYKGFHSAGVPVGAYYYGVAKTPAEAKTEAETCIKLLEGKKLELPVYYDIEEQNTQGGVKDLTPIVEAFCKSLEDAGYFAGFYTMLSWAQSKMDYPSLAKQFTSWIAWLDGDPADKLTPAPDAHQYTWKGKCSGISGGVDYSNFYRDFPSIIKGAGLNGYGNSGDDQKEEPSSVITWEEAAKKLKLLGYSSIKL